MKGRLGLLCGVNIHNLLAGHEALLMVNGGINAAVPANVHPRDAKSCDDSGLAQVLRHINWRPASCQRKQTDKISGSVMSFEYIVTTRCYKWNLNPA